MFLPKRCAREGSCIALDLLNEARQRRWFLLPRNCPDVASRPLAVTLRLEVVDGMLAATSLFGQDVHTDRRAADLAMRPLFRAVSYTIFYGGLAFGILACADFGPSLLSPGRIEHLLALPVRRWELLLGTFPRRPHVLAATRRRVRSRRGQLDSCGEDRNLDRSTRAGGDARQRDLLGRVRAMLTVAVFSS